MTEWRPNEVVTQRQLLEVSEYTRRLTRYAARWKALAKGLYAGLLREAEGHERVRAVIIRQRDENRAELAALRDVAEAARAWATAWGQPGHPSCDCRPCLLGRALARLDAVRGKGAP
jgi:hypothetical protein